MESQQAKQGENWLIKLAGSRYLAFILRLVLGGIFLVSSLGKMVDIEAYSVKAVSTFGILPVVLARPFGLVMPFIELAVALGLLFGVLTRLSALGSGLMCVAFFIAKAVVLAQGRDIDCGCFGAVVSTLASVTIYMDIPMLIFSLIVMLAPFGSRNWRGLGNRLPGEWKEKLRLIW